MARGQSSESAWLERTADLPAEPGVYLMKDAAGKVIYVGKAKSLKPRVRSYFQKGSSDYRAFIAILGNVLGDIETIVTRSEKEALILERELIRKHEPRFNIIWRDDKQFLCLRIDPTHEYPRVEVVRRMGKDGARYFGPFHSATAARQTLRVINRFFQLRTCRDTVLYNRSRPCLEYQIGRCPAPCVLEIDRGVYGQSVDDAILFLEGKGRTLVQRLEKRMWSAAEGMEYELAARLRDQIGAVKKTLEPQEIALPSMRDQDVLGFHREGPDLCIAVLEIRGGRIQSVHSHLFTGQAFSDGEVIESFLLQSYETREDVPAEVIVPVELEGREALSELLGERRGRKVEVLQPQRGERARVLDLARQNAEHAFAEKRAKSGANLAVLEGLKQKLQLTKLPVRIECYDISNLQGRMIVGSRVAFEEGVPVKSRYRRYRIRSREGQDDFGSMYEVILRRLRRGKEEADLPDLIVIDGGKGQLNAARAAMRDTGVDDVDIVALAKSRLLDEDGGLDDRSSSNDPGSIEARGAPDEETRRIEAEESAAPVVATDQLPVIEPVPPGKKPRRSPRTRNEEVLSRSPERVFLPNAKDPIVLKQSSAEVFLLARIRDEAHRFAITFHQDLRTRASLRSTLEEIPGVGPKRQRALLQHLGSVKRVKEASLEELEAVPGMGKAAARQVHEFFHPQAPGQATKP